VFSHNVTSTLDYVCKVQLLTDDSAEFCWCHDFTSDVWNFNLSSKHMLVSEAIWLS